MTKTECMWAIVGIHGLYIGTWLTRKEAITEHLLCFDGDIWDRKYQWNCRRAEGDRCVKVTITYEVQHDQD